MRVRATRMAVTLMVAALAAVVMVPATSAPSSAATEGFRDVTGGHQFYKEISWMNQEGITTGYTWDDTFRPTQKVSREAFAAYLYRLAGKPAVSLPNRSPFKDVPKSSQFYKEIVWLSKQNITTGWADGTFRPKSNIARDAMAAFLYRYEGRPSFKAPSSSPFKDVPKSAQFYKEITWLRASGITTGYSDGTFRPYTGTSREATAAFLFRGYAPSGYKAPAYQAPSVDYSPSRMLNVAADEVGYRESSWRTNKYNSWIGSNYAWCHVYIAWVFEKSGYTGLVPKTGYFPTYVRMLRDEGVLDTSVSKADLDPGDVVLIDWNGGNTPTHTGIVHRVSGNGVWLYEGNTTDGTGDSSRGVFHRYRSLGSIYASYDPMDYYHATH
jgi:hypothetical protein